MLLQARYNKSQVAFAYFSAPFSTAAACVSTDVPCRDALLHDVTLDNSTCVFAFSIEHLTTDDKTCSAMIYSRKHYQIPTD
jgi:hypothetical protein